MELHWYNLVVRMDDDDGVEGAVLVPAVRKLDIGMVGAARGGGGEVVRNHNRSLWH
jgi:hypothetical protein